MEQNWNGYISLLPTIGSVIRTYCLWKTNMKLVKNLLYKKIASKILLFFIIYYRMRKKKGKINVHHRRI